MKNYLLILVCILLTGCYGANIETETTVEHNFSLTTAPSHIFPDGTLQDCYPANIFPVFKNMRGNTGNYWEVTELKDEAFVTMDLNTSVLLFTLISGDDRLDLYSQPQYSGFNKTVMLPTQNESVLMTNLIKSPSLYLCLLAYGVTADKLPPVIHNKLTFKVSGYYETE